VQQLALTSVGRQGLVWILLALQGRTTQLR
jgi:hypothetical protein